MCPRVTCCGAALAGSAREEVELASAGASWESPDSGEASASLEVVDACSAEFDAATALCIERSGADDSSSEPGDRNCTDSEPRVVDGEGSEAEDVELEEDAKDDDEFDETAGEEYAAAAAASVGESASANNLGDLMGAASELTECDEADGEGDEGTAVSAAGDDEGDSEAAEEEITAEADEDDDNACVVGGDDTGERGDPEATAPPGGVKVDEGMSESWNAVVFGADCVRPGGPPAAPGAVPDSDRGETRLVLATSAPAAARSSGASGLTARMRCRPASRSGDDWPGGETLLSFCEKRSGEPSRE